MGERRASTHGGEVRRDRGGRNRRDGFDGVKGRGDGRMRWRVGGFVGGGRLRL